MALMRGGGGTGGWIWDGGCTCVWGLEGFKGVRGGGEVQGGPVVVTSDLSARSRASQKPLQMHPAWEPPVPQRERGKERTGSASLSCHRCHRAACALKSAHKTSTLFVSLLLLTTSPYVTFSHCGQVVAPCIHSHAGLTDASHTQIIC